jgi:hypothetical protein
MKMINPALRKFLSALCLSLTFVSVGFSQTSTNNSVPVVTILAADNHGTWASDPAVFTVFRLGNPSPALNVYCCISGTASNGVDYQSIGNFVFLGAGVMSNTIVINPINTGQTNTRSVEVDLCPSPLMNPVNYEIGSPGSAVVFITPPGVSNLPPAVSIISPTNGAVYNAPANISLIAKASDPDGTVTNVEYFSGTADLGRGLPVVLDPPGVNGITGLVYFFNWQNIPAGAYPLTAVATDNDSLSTSSAVVNITVLGQSNLPPVVSIVSPTNGAVYNAPANISLIAKASDPTGTVTNVEYFAGTTDLGRGLPVILDPPGANGVTGLVYFFNWQNVPADSYPLTAVATDNGGRSTTSAVVNITVLGQSNLPPVVRITSPPNGSIFRAPMEVPIYSYATDPTGVVTTVEFFANGSSLGFGQHVTAVPPPLPPGPVQPPILIVVPTNYWNFIWTNPPVGTNFALAAKATDNAGLSSTSAPVLVSILPPLQPPTNRPALVTIVATDPIAIEGTNCWTWPGLVSPVATWSNWFAASATWRFFTNCGPKDATFTVFRSGATNNTLTVTYAIGGTATNGIDYVALPGTVTIPAGERRAAITIIPLDDGPPDITSTVVLKLVADSTGTNYLLGQPRSAAVIILDSQSPRAVTGVMPGAAFNLAASGPDGAWFHVEYSTDMIHWTPICTNQVVNGSIDFVDPDAATNPSRFYRTVPEAGPPQ